MDYVLIGKIQNTFGIRGELKVLSYTDFAPLRFKKGSTVYIGEDHLPFSVATYREHSGLVLVSFADHQDINLVEKYKDQLVYKAREDIKPLKKGEYYFSDLKDLSVYCDGQLKGKALRVEEGTTHNNLRVKCLDGSEHLVPFILDVFILNVDLETKRIDIVNMEGLL